MTSPVVAGIDMGGTKILGVAYRMGGGSPTAVAEHRVPTPTGSGAVLDAILEVVGAITAERPIDALGLGVPGLVDRAGTLRFGPNLPGIVDFPFRERLGSRVSVPVVIENDATCATWAEHECGAARSVDDALLVTLGTGIGAGLVAGGALQRGANGFAGEAGHMVVDPTGPPCPCGRRGCWERYASGAGLGRLGRDAAQAGVADGLVELAGGDPEAVRGENVTSAAAAGDVDALAIVAEFAHWTALGLANLVNLLDSEVVVIGGGLVAAAELFLPSIREAYAGMILAAERRPPLRIEAAQLGEEAGSLGAGLLAAAEVAA